MRRLIPSLLIGLMLCGGFGCSARITKIMKSWEGKHKSRLIRSWGLPSEIGSDGLGGEVYVYRWSSSWTAPGTSKTTIKTDRYGNKAKAKTTYYPGETFTFKKYRAFWIDEQGYIYSWKWRGW